MKAKSQNKELYTSLKKRAGARKQTKVEINKATRDVISGLLPKVKESKDKDSNNYKKMLNQAQSNYDKKLASLSKAYSNKLNESIGVSTDKIKGLETQLKKGDKKFNTLLNRSSNSFAALNSQIRELAKQKSNVAVPTQPAPVPTSGAVTRSYEDTPLFDFNISPTSYQDTLTSPLPPITNTADSFNSIGLASLSIDKESLGVGSFIDFGNYQIKLTNKFGIRSGANAVKGVPETEHSNGIDIRLYKDNKPVDLPISIADGTIVKIELDGSSTPIPTSEGRVGGYYMYVQLDEDPTKIVKYVHLPKEVFSLKGDLMGKHLKRGDIIVNSTGTSGTGTAPHIKVAVGTYDAKTNKSFMDYSKKENDPTNLLLTGSL